MKELNTGNFNSCAAVERVLDLSRPRLPSANPISICSWRTKTSTEHLSRSCSTCAEVECSSSRGWNQISTNSAPINLSNYGYRSRDWGSFPILLIFDVRVWFPKLLRVFHRTLQSCPSACAAHLFSAIIRYHTIFPVILWSIILIQKWLFSMLYSLI